MPKKQQVLVVVSPFPSDVSGVVGELEASTMTDAEVMSQVRLWAERTVAVVFFKRDGKLYFASSDKPPPIK